MVAPGVLRRLQQVLADLRQVILGTPDLFAQLLDAVEEPLDVAAAGEIELLPLIAADPTDLVDECNTRLQSRLDDPAARLGGSLAPEDVEVELAIGDPDPRADPGGAGRRFLRLVGILRSTGPAAPSGTPMIAVSRIRPKVAAC